MVGGARLSLVAAETSAGTFFGTPREGSSATAITPYLQLAFGTIIGRILVSYIFIKPYYDYKVFSIYEYLTARFRGCGVRMRLRCFHDYPPVASGARLYSGAIALALAYEMISGTRPNQTQTLDLYRGHVIAIVIPHGHLHHVRCIKASVI
jgi:hypothetical protein